MLAIESEQALLGIVLLDDTIIPSVEHLSPDQFYEPAHAYLWGEILRTYKAGRKVEYRIIKPYVARYTDRLGEYYLEDLIEKCPPATTAGNFAAEIVNAWQIRQLSSSLEAVSNSTDANEAFGFVRGEIERIELSRPVSDEFVSAQDAARASIDAMIKTAQTGEGLGLKCGLKCVDERLGGLQSGHLIVIGGRPAMGKTSLADNISYGAASLNPDKAFMFYNLEMDSNELSNRQLSAHAYKRGDYIQYRQFLNPSLELSERIAKHTLALPNNLFILDKKRVSVDDIRRGIWRMKSKYDVGAVFIDYLQLLQLTSSPGKNDAKVIAEATAELKRIAGEAKVCVVLLSQLSRSVEMRENKRPMMSDLRDSGGIEQDANAILFPYREYYYLKHEQPKDPQKVGAWQARLSDLQHVMEVICAKNRGGETGDDQLYCSLGYDIVLNEAPYDTPRWEG